MLSKSDNDGHCTFIIISRSFILKMKNVSDKIVEKNHTFMSSNFFFSKIVPFMRQCKKIVDAGRQQMTIWRTRVACWMPKAKNTH